MDSVTLKTDALSLTEEEFFHFCQQNRDLRFERDADQNIIVMSPTGSFTGYYNQEVLGQLFVWNKFHKLGFCFDSSSGFTLPSGAIRSPDVAWIKRERYLAISQPDRKRFTHICPDFIIEIKSDTDSLKQLKVKMTEWVDNGVRLAWLLDFDELNVYVFKPERSIIEQPFSTKLSGEEVLPGFELNFDFVNEI